MQNQALRSKARKYAAVYNGKTNISQAACLHLAKRVCVCVSAA